MNRVFVLIFAAVFAVCAPSVDARKPPTAEISVADKAVKVGTATEILVTVSEENLPGGYFYSVNASVLSDNVKNAEITTGFPVTKVVASKAGEYEVNVIVGLVKKTTCATASHYEIAEETVRVTVE